MARDGAGTFNLETSARTSGTVISSTDYNTDMNSFATALTASIAKDGQTTPTANLPMGTYRHTGVGNASARTHYAVVGQIQDGSYIWCGTAGGTANALTLTPSPAITAYAAGQSFEFKAGSSASSSAVTVAISGLSTIAIQQDGAALVSGEIEANKFYRITLDTTSTAQLLKIGAPTFAAASETVAGKIEIATAAETTTGTDDTRAITPLKLTTFAPASATFDTANDKLIALDATDSKLKQMAFPSVSGKGAIMVGVSNAGATSGTIYLGRFDIATDVGTEANVSFQMPFAGTFTGLYATAYSAPGAAQTFVYTLRINGSDTAITCTTSGGAATTSNGSGSVAFSAGDTISVKVVISAGATNVPHWATIGFTA